MEFNLKYNSPFDLTLESSVNVSEINSTFDEIYNHLASNSRVKGFRNKKIPINVVKTNFADKAKVMVGNLLVQKAYDYTKKQPLKYIELTDDLSFLKNPPEENKSYKFLLKFSVQPMPKIESSLTGMKLDMPDIVSTEDKINWHLDFYRATDNKKYMVEDRGAEEFDILVADIKVHLDGTYCKTLSKNPGVLHLSSKTNPKEMVDALIGVKPGETRTYKMETKSNSPYFIDRATKNYFVKVYKIVASNKVPLDDTLAKKFHHTSVDDLKNFVKSVVKYECSVEARHNLKKQIIDILLKEQTVELTPQSIDKQKEILKRELSNEMSILGWPIEQINKKLSDLDSELEKESIDKCSLELIISQIIAELKIIPTKRELESKIKEIASSERVSSNEIKKRFSSKQGITYLNYLASKDKVFDHIIGNAKLNKSEESNENA